MSGNFTGNSESIIRSELWQAQLEEILHENLLGVPFVRQVDFPDGTAFTMPSIGTPLTRDLPEGAEVTFDALDTGEVTITMNEPIISANSISEVLLEDSMWAQDLLSAVPEEQAQAIMERFETDTLALAMQQFAGTDNENKINGVAHRKIGSGTNETMATTDFAFAGYSLKKAKIARKNLVAIVDPSVAYALETATNLSNVSNNPRWEGIIESGIEQNYRFIRNVYGFDVFESNMLPDMNETIGGKTTTAGKANLFMSLARPSIAPFVLAWRRKPKLVSEFNNKLKQLEIDTTARWGSGFRRIIMGRESITSGASAGNKRRAATHYGTREVQDKIGSKYAGKHGEEVYEVTFNYDDLPAEGLDEAILRIPVGARVTAATLHVVTAFAGGTSLTVGLNQPDGTVIDADGLITAANAPLANIDADSDVIDGTGVLVGAVTGLAAEGQVVVAASGTFTAGKATVRVTFEPLVDRA
jgi:hypothetical protein